MTESTLAPDLRFAEPATAEVLDRTAEALVAHGFAVHVVDSPEDARALVADLVPEGSEVFTATSETLRQAGIEDDITAGGRHEPLRPKLYALDYATQRDQIRKLGSAPDVVLGSVHAVTEDGRLVVASATGSQLGPYASGAGKLVLVVGAQKIVPDLDTAFERIERYSYPLEDVRARQVYGRPSAVNKILVVNAEADPTRTTVVLVRTAIGY